MNTNETDEIRKRLGELNTKAYYLLVALSFVYRTNPTRSLKVALTLTAVVAVLPVQDLLKSKGALNFARWSKAVLLTAALVFALWWVWCAAASPAAAAQNPSSTKTTEQAQTNQPPAQQEPTLKSVEEKADRALMEKDYIERIQKEAKDYYESAFQTEEKFLDRLTIIAAALPVLIGFLGLGFVNRLIKDRLREASTQLRTEFNQRLEERFAQLQADLKIVSQYEFFYLRGMAATAADRHGDSIPLLRRALASYKSGRPRNLIDKLDGIRTLRNLFVSIQKTDPTAADANARKELADPLYNDLDEELHEAAMYVKYITEPIKQRNAPRPSAEPGSAAPQPAPAAAVPENQKPNAPTPPDP